MAKQKSGGKWLKVTLSSLLGVIAIFLGFYGSIYLGLWGEIPTKKQLSDFDQSQASRVFDKEGILIGKYFITDRETVKFEELPENLINALVATEDARFYKHKGVDERSLMRVFIKTLVMGDRSSGGGSTITLQLAKNLYGRKNYGRLSVPVNKLRESIVARRLEKVYSKNEILALYFNTVPFSGNTYGIESAAQKFFGKPTKELNLSEAATLIGTLKANHSYNPRLFPEQSEKRRNVVLSQMEKYHYVLPEKIKAAQQERLKINFKSFDAEAGLAPYFREQVKRVAKKLLADKKLHKSNGSLYNINQDGLRIYTTLDARMQEHAEEAMQTHMTVFQKQFEQNYGQNAPWKGTSALVQNSLKRLPLYKRLQTKELDNAAIKDSLQKIEPRELFGWDKVEVRDVSVIDSLSHYLKFLNTGLVSIDPHTGAVRAYIGGINQRYFQYDHVVQSSRQVGSTFKPFIYTAALENGIGPCDYFPTKAVSYTDQKNWTPKNANDDLDSVDNVSVSASLTHSLNTVAVEVLRETGIENGIAEIQKLGITKKIEHEPSIALGTTDLRVIDLAKAYTGYLNEGRSVTPFIISRIENKEGEVLFEHKMKENPAAMSEETREMMLEILKKVVNEGTAQRLRTVYGFQNELAGKTGTTQSNTDGWFVGLLPDLVTVTWVGHDNPQIKLGTTAFGQGANSALPIFAEMLKGMNADAKLNAITHSRFKPASSKVIEAMKCSPTKKDGFLKRVFGKKENEKSFQKSERERKKAERKQVRRKKNKKGFFKRLFGGKK